MKKISFGVFLCLVGMNVGTTINAAPKTDDSNPQYPSSSWLRQSKAEIRVLNKLESSIQTFTVPVGESVQYKTLTIAIKKCVTRPTNTYPDSAAFLDITDSQLKTIHFSAWVLSAEPGVSVFEHPLYNVSMIGCTGIKGNDPLTSEIPTEPLPNNTAAQPSNPQSPDSAQDLERSLEDKLNSQH